MNNWAHKIDFVIPKTKSSAVEVIGLEKLYDTQPEAVEAKMAISHNSDDYQIFPTVCGKFVLRSVRDENEDIC